MSNSISDFTRPTTAQSPADVHRLAALLRERFPEEAASADLSKPDEVLRLAMELLTRLWRWER